MTQKRAKQETGKGKTRRSRGEAKTKGAAVKDFGGEKRKILFCFPEIDLRHCVGCGSPIHDQFILRVAPNLEWHAACLKCCECQMFLDETHTCFVREGKTYCKKDYVRYKMFVSYSVIHTIRRKIHIYRESNL